MDVAMFDPDQFIAQKFFRSKRCSLNANKEYVLAELIMGSPVESVFSLP
jgi:hypothetical protein